MIVKNFSGYLIVVNIYYSQSLLQSKVLIISFVWDRLVFMRIISPYQKGLTRNVCYYLALNLNLSP